MNTLYFKGALLTPEERAEIVLTHERLIHSVCKRYTKVLAEYSSIDYDDLVSEATIGLLRAIDKFDPDRFEGINGNPVKFSTYAVPTMNGQILRFLRDHSVGVKYSRTIKEAYTKMKKSGLLYTDSGILLRPEEIAEKLDLDPALVSASLEYGRTYLSRSIDEPLHNGEDSEKLTLGDVLADNDTASGYEAAVVLDEFLTYLNDQEREIVALYRRGLVQSEIGKILGVSQVQISRRLKSILHKAGLFGKGILSPVKKASDRKSRNRPNQADISTESGVVRFTKTRELDISSLAEKQVARDFTTATAESKDRTSDDLIKRVALSTSQETRPIQSENKKELPKMLSNTNESSRPLTESSEIPKIQEPKATPEEVLVLLETTSHSAGKIAELTGRSLSFVNKLAKGMKRPFPIKRERRDISVKTKDEGKGKAKELNQSEISQEVVIKKKKALTELIPAPAIALEPTPEQGTSEKLISSEPNSEPTSSSSTSTSLTPSEAPPTFSEGTEKGTEGVYSEALTEAPTASEYAPTLPFTSGVALKIVNSGVSLDQLEHELLSTVSALRQLGLTKVSFTLNINN